MTKPIQEGHDNHSLILIINDKKYEWTHQYITGFEIRKLANIAEADEIFLVIKKPWEDELIKDDTKVDLARPGIEHFFSKKPDIVIIVNAEDHVWNKETISYEQVVKLAFENYVENSPSFYTVTYKHGPAQNPSGTMVKGDKVFVKSKMNFNVTPTDKS